MFTPTKQEFAKGENEQTEGNLGDPREWEKSTNKLFYSLIYIYHLKTALAILKENIRNFL